MNSGPHRAKTVQMLEYAPYLERIIAALQQRPSSPPTWVVALLGSIVGGLFAVTAQIARAIFDERRKRKLLIRTMHQELKKNFLTIYQTWQPLTIDPVAADPGFVGYFKEAVTFLAQELLRRNPEVYLLAPEHWISETLYFSFKRITTTNPDQLDNLVKDSLFLYAWNVVNDGVFKTAVQATLTSIELDELIPKAEACLQKIPVPPMMFALMAAMDKQTTPTKQT